MLHQSQKNYARANFWLRVLLEPVFKMIDDDDGIGLGMYYRYEKRGEWHHRLVTNLVHMDYKEEALRYAERVLHFSGRNDPAVEYEKALAKRVEGNRRLLVGKLHPEFLGLNARYEAEQYYFLKVHDRMALERAVIQLHCPPRRWGPLPKNLCVRTVRSCPKVFLNGTRAPHAGWCDATLEKEPCGVEQYVANWYTNGRGRREQGWRCVHCEGAWFALLARIIVSDVTTQLEDHHAAQPSYLWLTVFQTEPLDASFGPSLVARAGDKLRLILDYLSTCSREEFLSFVQHRATTAERSPYQITTGADGLMWTDASDGDGRVSPSSAEGLDGQRKRGGTPKVDVSSLPELIDMCRCVPQRELCNMIRTLLFSPQSKGYCWRFSGFPDLVAWQPPQDPTDGGHFKLSEVKSPLDSLSDKQIATIDALIQSGFDVDVVQVVDAAMLQDIGKPRVRRAQARHPSDVAERRIRRNIVVRKGSALDPVIV
jgi:hypothetical protein